MNFTFQTNKKMLFGSGAALNAWKSFQDEYSGKILLLTGHSVLKSIPGKKIIESGNNQIIHKEISGEPNPEQIDSLIRIAKEENIIAVASLGGGSVLDTGKAVAALSCEEGKTIDYLEGVGILNPSGKTLPFLAMPTTAGTGSEATKNAVISNPGKEGFKKSLRHDNYIPDIAAIDPDFLKSQTPELLARCGMDAFCQLIESYISDKSSLFTDNLIEAVIPDFIPALLAVCKGKGNNRDFETLALGSYISGITLANAGLGTIHGMGGPLGGYCSIPHGTACALLSLPVLDQTVSKLDFDSETINKLENAGKVLDPEESIGGLLTALKFITDRWIKNRLSDFNIVKADIPVIAQKCSDKDFPVTFSLTEKEEILLSLL